MKNNTMTRVLKAVPLAALMIAVVALVTSVALGDRPAAVHGTVVATGEVLGSVVWTDQDGLVVVNDTPAGPQLAHVQAGTFVNLAPLALTGCDRPVVAGAGRTREGRLAALATCWDDLETTDASIFVRDDGEWHRIARLDPRVETAAAMAIDETTGRALLTYDQSWCSTLIEATLGGSRLLPWTISDERHTVRLDADPPSDGEGCPDRPFVEDVALSPDGETLLLAISMDAVGREGTSRAQARVDLYAGSIDGTGWTRVAKGINRRLAFTPDGRSVTFSERDSGDGATYLLDLGTGTRRRIYPRPAGFIAVSPDGRQAALVVTHDDDPAQDDIVVVDLPPPSA